jgi:tetratricopeptide (TPR) repeat protein
LILSYIGTTYQALGNYPAALDYHQQSLTRFRELGEKVAEVHALQQISAIYQLLGNNSEAEVYLAQSLSLFHELGNRP